jgi:hypothetical protein
VAWRSCCFEGAGRRHGPKPTSEVGNHLPPTGQPLPEVPTGK